MLCFNITSEKEVLSKRRTSKGNEKKLQQVKQIGINYVILPRIIRLFSFISLFQVSNYIHFVQGVSMFMEMSPAVK